MNGAGLHQTARHVLIIIGGAHYFTGNVLLPDQVDTLYWAVGFTFVPMVVFSLNERIGIILTYSWFLLTLLGSEVVKLMLVNFRKFPEQFAPEAKYVGVITLSAFCGTFIYYYRSAAARAEAELAASNEQLRALLNQDARYLEWLRSMASFLRHEVRQPLAQINSSIELSRLILQSDSRATPYLSNATLGVHQVSSPVYA